MEEPVRKINLSEAGENELRSMEWLVANGLGGYASGTLSGGVSRQYHGLLVASLPAPYGRTVMLDRLFEKVRFPGGMWMNLHGNDEDGKKNLSGIRPEVEFRLEMGLPVWQFRFGEVILEKRIIMPHGQNTVRVSYHYLNGSDTLHLQFEPAMRFRMLGAEGRIDGPYRLSVTGDRYEIAGTDRNLQLRLMLVDNPSSLCLDKNNIREIFYPTDAQLGSGPRGPLWAPGNFETELAPRREITFIASTEPFQIMRCMSQKEVLSAEKDRRRHLLYRSGAREEGSFFSELVLSADQFLIAPAGRSEHAARARAGGNDIRSVIAGYHWFTDWGRDTMISLDGLTLCTGRHDDAAWILRTFAYYMRWGLIPNLFPEGEIEGLYHTADATLWYFHAVDRYVEVTGDRETLRLLLPHLKEVIFQHRRGTKFGIGVDPEDKLLRQGKEGFQLTWMDAKVDDWVVTPRRGKAVEINALWYNALCLMRQWTMETDKAISEEYETVAQGVYDSFNRRFWYEKGNYLYDVVDGENGDDPALRPNQLFALSLKYPVLDPRYWQTVVEKVRMHLLTPMGLRSLSPEHPEYKSRYFGDLRSRDAAYHQGTVWAWLIGPFIDAWLKVYPDDKATARGFLEKFRPHLDEAGIGTISEVFDGDAPYTSRGCIAQAWSIAEVLRCWRKTGEGRKVKGEG